MDQETAARVLVGDSLGFHIIFALLSIGIPVLMLIFETIAVRTNNSRLLQHVKGWSKIMAIFAVAGVISGTLVAMQFNLIWPQFMEIASPVVGPGFMFEGYFFLIEAIFLAFYLATWDKVKGYKHVLLGVPIALGAIGSAVVITLVNGWMSEPLGFTMQNGEVTNVNSLQALFTTTGLIKVAHSVPAYIAATSLFFGGIYAALSLRRKLTKNAKDFYQKMVLRLMIITVIFTGITMALGHTSAVHLANVEPVKLAAFELHYGTGDHAPIIIGGSLNDDTKQVEGGLVIPNLLSMLVGMSPTVQVVGLDSVPESQWPSLIVHPMFDIKMAAAILMLVLPVAFIALWWLAKKYTWLERAQPLVTVCIALGSLLGIVVVELGWMIAEIGRQPYTIKGVLFTADAFTKDNDVVTLGLMFPVAFLLLLGTTIAAVVIVIRKLSKKDFAA